MIKLFSHQKKALSKLRTGSILCGGVGSGKSITALAYYYTRECKGKIPDGDNVFTEMKTPKDLYIITTAKKRDSLEWEGDCLYFMLSSDRENSVSGVQVTVDSWNNLDKYVGIKGAFFIFDEQKVSGSGSWVRSFLKVTKLNSWILLSATPGDTWMNYIPVFVANGFYNNRTEFLRRHVVFNLYSPYPKVDHYVEVPLLESHAKALLVEMPVEKKTIRHTENHILDYDKALFETVTKKRWHPYENRPIRDVAELCALMRKVVSIDKSRQEKLKELLAIHAKIIVFYNFNYELDILRQLAVDLKVEVAEYNGYKHQPVPEGENWLYLVQYTSGSEAWNCIETNCIVFYSLNYAYWVMTQAEGRIDRINTPYVNLYYHRFTSDSLIDKSIEATLVKKEVFNERKFVEKTLRWGYTY